MKREKNILIAEFMGQELKGEMAVFESGMFGMGTKTLLPLAYDTDWSWLMPVVAKIWTISKKLDGEYWEDNEFYKSFYELTIHNLYITSTIETVYNAVIQFITWYNQQPTNKQGPRH